MKNYIKLLSLVFITGILISSCKKNEPLPSSTIFYYATLSGSAEIPANSSTTTAGLTAIYNTDTKTLALIMDYSGINPTDWHIHKGAAGTAGPIEFSLGAIVPSPLNISLTLTAEQEAELAAGNYYINIHSAAYPDGEIRGQIMR